MTCFLLSAARTGVCSKYEIQPQQKRKKIVRVQPQHALDSTLCFFFRKEDYLASDTHLIVLGDSGETHTTTAALALGQIIRHVDRLTCSRTHSRGVQLQFAAVESLAADLSLSARHARTAAELFATPTACSLSQEQFQGVAATACQSKGTV